jgi:6-phosphogluconolactonase
MQTIITEDLDALNRRAVSIIRECARKAIQARGRFTITLSGGSSVKPIYEQLAAIRDLDWTRCFFFFSDERFVETSNPYSTFRLTDELLFSRLPGLPRGNLFPVPVEANSPKEGARQYGETIRRFFGLERGELPRFDLALLGMGRDGHTASLFPHISRDPEAHQIARMTHAGLSPWVDRVTLTYAVFNQARAVLFAASGEEKAEALRAVLEETPNHKHWPASGIRPVDGELIWLVEPQIARLLTRR